MEKQIAGKAIAWKSRLTDKGKGRNNSRTENELGNTGAEEAGGLDAPCDAVTAGMLWTDRDRMIRMEGIDKGYQLGEEKVPVLQDVCFTVRKGEFVAILGPSGSGKTTLMNLIGCMDVPDAGSYYLAGRPVHKMQEQELTRVRNEEIGFVFQNYQLIPTYNVLENIMMPLLARGMSSKEAEEKCRDTISLLGLSHRLRHRPNELSGGQKQRVSIARALVGEPAVLLADEPTGALDSASGQEVLKLFHQLNELGHTIVMITHDLHVAQAAGRIVHIVDGRLSEST